MKKGWTTVQLATIAGLGILRLITALPGAAIAGITGVPYLSGAINFLSSGILYSITCLLIPHFGAATLMTIVFSVLAIPLPLIGPPGFLLKIIPGTLYGILADIVFLILKKNKKLAAIFIGGSSGAFAPIISLKIGYFLGLPGSTSLMKIFLKPVFIFSGAIFGSLTGYLGWIIYKKVKNTAIVKRIQGV